MARATTATTATPAPSRTTWEPSPDEPGAPSVRAAGGGGGVALVVGLAGGADPARDPAVHDLTIGAVVARVRPGLVGSPEVARYVRTRAQGEAAVRRRDELGHTVAALQHQRKAAELAAADDLAAALRRIDADLAAARAAHAAAAADAAALAPLVTQAREKAERLVRTAGEAAASAEATDLARRRHEVLRRLAAAAGPVLDELAVVALAEASLWVRLGTVGGTVLVELLGRPGGGLPADTVAAVAAAG